MSTLNDLIAETLETIVYWYRETGHIDESWLEEADMLLEMRTSQNDVKQAEQKNLSTQKDMSFSYEAHLKAAQRSSH